MSDSDSDAEYGPLTATWGSQASPVATSTHSDTIKAETAGWDSLIDPNIKTGPNDLGSGNLHRRGANFKPIDEELILAQRLNIQIPKKKMLDAIRQTEKNLGLPEDKNTRKGKSKKKKATAATSSPDRFLHRNNSAPPPKKEPVPSTIRPPPPASSNSNWLQSNLVDTPFWEKKESPPSSAPHTSLPASPATTTTSSSRDNNTKAAEKQPSTNDWSTFVKTTETQMPEKRNNQRELSTNKANNVGWDKYNTAFESEEWLKDSNDNSNFENGGWNKETKPDTTKHQWNTWVSETNSNISRQMAEPQPKKSSYDNTTTTTTNNNNNYNNIPSDRPSWLNPVPDTQQQQYSSIKSPPIANISRFSNPTKQRYSDAPTIDVPKPVNYRKDVNPVPLHTAPAPPPENSLLITINVELSDTLKIPVDIRELDDPSQLANEFGQKNNITAVNIITALTKLFSSQKDMALKKKQQKLQRRVPKCQSNVYTNSSPTRFSTYSSSPAYQNNTYQDTTYQKTGYQNIGYSNTTATYQNTRAATNPAPTPFTRKAHYY